MKQDRQIQIESALPCYREALSAMRRALYPHEPAATIENEIEKIARIGVIDGRAHDEAVGFVEVSDLGSTACHIESRYVRPEASRTRVGRDLLGVCKCCDLTRGARSL